MNITSNPTSSLSPVDQLCGSYISEIFTIFTSLTVIVGLIGNVFIVIFSLKESKTRSSPYIVFLANLSVNNLYGVVVSLPCFYLDYCTTILTRFYYEVQMTVSFVQLFSQFQCLGVGIHVLAAMCYDRYDAFTNLPSERKLTVRTAKKLAFFIWLVITLTTLTSFSGHFISYYDKTALIFSLKVINPNKIDRNTITPISNYFLIALVTVWMIVCNTTFLITIRRVRNEIRH